jgi:hypothetical protein
MIRRVVVGRHAAFGELRMYTSGHNTLSSYPKFEFSNLQDDPTKGYKVKLFVDGDRVVLAYLPQLGPRKGDPNDPAPQFDFAARRSIRLFQHEIAGVLTVCEGNASKQVITTPNHDLSFEQLEKNGFTLQGTVSKKSNPVPWSIRFEGYQATMLRHFMKCALEASFGFHEQLGAAPATDDTRQNDRPWSRGNNPRGSNVASFPTKSSKAAPNFRSDRNAATRNTNVNAAVQIRHVQRPHHQYNHMDDF